MDISFLKSERFWAVVVNAVVLYLQQKGFIGQPELILVTAIVGPFITIGTLDRLGKNLGKTEVEAKEEIKEEKEEK